METKVESIIEVSFEGTSHYLTRDEAHELYVQLGEQLGLNLLKTKESLVDFVTHEVKMVANTCRKIEDFEGYDSSKTSELGINVITDEEKYIHEEFVIFLKENDAYDKYMKNRFDPEGNIEYRKIIYPKQKYIIKAFSWAFASEGYDYWDNLHDKWKDHLRQ